MEWSGESFGRFLIALGLTFVAYLFFRENPFSFEASSFVFQLFSALNLGIHEVGHFLFFLGHGFGEWGRFLTILGGSLLQWSVPLLCVLYFLFTRKWFSASVILFWFGQSLFDSVGYVADARTLIMPLLGGESSGHDWNYLLFEMGVIHKDAEIAYALLHISRLIVVASVILTWFFFLRGMLSGENGK